MALRRASVAPGRYRFAILHRGVVLARSLYVMRPLRQAIMTGIVESSSWSRRTMMVLARRGADVLNLTLVS